MRRFWLREELDQIRQVFAATPWLLFGVLSTLPFYTLAMRNTLSGLVVAFVTPSVGYGLVILAAALTGRFTGLSVEQFQDGLLRHGREIFIAYCAVVYWLGYRRFLNFQEMDPQGKEIKLPGRFREALAPLANMFKPSYSSPMKSLVRKEMELQRGIFIIAATVTAMLLCEAIAWKLHPIESIGAVMAITLACYLMLVPTMAGVTAVAEERHLGTMAWQLTLPVSRRVQWRVKFSVALLTFVVVGLGLPMLWILIGKYVIGMPGLLDSAHKDFMDALYAWGPVFMGGFFLSLFASSIANNSMRATLTSIVLAWACAGIFISQLPRLLNHGLPHPHLVYFIEWLFAYLPAGAIFPVLLYGLVSGWFVLLGCLAGVNFRRNEPSKTRSWCQAALIVVFVYLAVPVIESGTWVEGNHGTGSDAYPVSSRAPWHSRLRIEQKPD
jgi:hypothetical protein